MFNLYKLTFSLLYKLQIEANFFYYLVENFKHITMERFTIDEFRAPYLDEDACLQKLFKLRFSGLICPKCENDKSIFSGKA